MGGLETGGNYVKVGKDLNAPLTGSRWQSKLARSLTGKLGGQKT